MRLGAKRIPVCALNGVDPNLTGQHDKVQLCEN
jgi:hypothetical protein